MNKNEQTTHGGYLAKSAKSLAKEYGVSGNTVRRVKVEVGLKLGPT